MKKIVITLFVLNSLIFFTLAGLVVLSETHPLPPGSALYGLQHSAEQLRLHLAGGPERRAELALDLASRRTADLARAGSPDRVHSAAQALNSAIDEAIGRIDALPDSAQGRLFEQLKALAVQAEAAITALPPAGADPGVAALGQKIETLRQANTRQEMVALLPKAQALGESIPIPFLGDEVDHSLYPLEGGHAGVDCTACHPDGHYADTPTDCEYCHPLPQDGVYPFHFEGACEDCHDVETWIPFEFDHDGVVECQSCHLDENPAEHYARPESYTWLLAWLGGTEAFSQTAWDYSPMDACAPCHPDTADWNKTDFDHLGFDDCLACHPPLEDPEHPYDQQCSLCHGTADWQRTEYDHADVSECISCHQGQSPTDHYVRADSSLWYAAWLPEQSPRLSRSRFITLQTPDTCINCHADINEWAEASFDHSGYTDCLACHGVEDTPAGHYAGQCSNCHNTTDWDQVQFDHTGYDDCQACHEAEAGHYPGPCSACHDTEDWRFSWFDHTGFYRCSDCHTDQAPDAHYSLSCANCHTSEKWGRISFDHTDFPDCIECHGQTEHYRGQCSNCHTTDTWDRPWFNHTGYRDCTGCHERQAPPRHYHGQCAPCHTTTTWSDLKINHSTSASCQNCHASPPSHYAEVCTKCHATDRWSLVSVDHGGFNDCETCHEPPAEHYPGACAECHNPSAWRDVEYNHNGLVDCLDCHKAPAGHWSGACLNCHCTCDWSNIVYTHDINSNCEACHARPGDHYSGDCTECHNTEDWNDFIHSMILDCDDCHQPPDGHWPGQCSQCHNVDDWADYVFDHTGYAQCNSCHVQIRPPSHPRGLCSRCHTTESWTIPTTPAPAPTDATPTPEATATVAPARFGGAPISPGPEHRPGPEHTPEPPKPGP
ncbi:MAG: DUF5667 domain-containing protein [Anaerolineae bacterium]|jgi:hypothetical protein